MLNIKHMEYFTALAEIKNYSRAAAMLKISQPTLSQTVQKLETTLGAALFDRSFSELTLTEPGKVFYDACLRICDIHRQTVRRISELNDGIVGEVRLGLAPFRAPFMLPQIAIRFAEKYPNVKLNTDELLSNEIVEKLDRGEIDLAVTAFKEKGNPNYVAVPVMQENVYIALHCERVRENEILRQYADSDRVEAVDFSSFAGTDFILLGEEQFLSITLEKLSEKYDVKLTDMIRCRTTETSLSLANHRLGAAIVLSSAAQDYRKKYPELCFFSLLGEKLDRTIYAVYRKNQYLTNPVKEILNILQTEELS